MGFYKQGRFAAKGRETNIFTFLFSAEETNGGEQMVKV